MDNRQKAKDLIELATDEGTTDKERISAATKAVALIRKYDLLSIKIPFEGLGGKAAKAAHAVGSTISDPEFIKKTEDFTRGAQKLKNSMEEFANLFGGGGRDSDDRSARRRRRRR